MLLLLLHSFMLRNSVVKWGANRELFRRGGRRGRGLLEVANGYCRVRWKTTARHSWEHPQDNQSLSLSEPNLFHPPSSIPSCCPIRAHTCCKSTGGWLTDSNQSRCSLLVAYQSGRQLTELSSWFTFWLDTQLRDKTKHFVLFGHWWAKLSSLSFLAVAAVCGGATRIELHSLHWIALNPASFQAHKRRIMIAIRSTKGAIPNEEEEYCWLESFWATWILSFRYASNNVSPSSIHCRLESGTCDVDKQ